MCGHSLATRLVVSFWQGLTGRGAKSSGIAGQSVGERTVTFVTTGCTRLYVTAGGAVAVASVFNL